MLNTSAHFGSEEVKTSFSSISILSTFRSLMLVHGYEVSLVVSNVMVVKARNV